MNQLTQQLKSGRMEILEVPFPVLGKKEILVRNHYSVISAGTEGKTVSDARKSYVAKALKRQKEIKQVLDMIRVQGLRETYKLIMNKLEAPSALGYSCAGEVIAVGEEIRSFLVGDHVACGGSTAVHADVVAVPELLCVKVPKETDLRQAAFTTIASIAIQGIRQAELSFGSTTVIIGLGLIGQLSMLILEATGNHAIGLDINPAQVGLAEKAGIKNVYHRNTEGIENIIIEKTSGLGADAVLITAATSSTDPVNLAGKICRKKGKVVIVGAVPTGFDRSDYYRKELDLRMSCSYGPGRYDPLYEEKGIDYPAGYVRWTENRNMQSFADLISSGKLDIRPIITHVFDLPDAPAAYKMILSKSEPFSGILIRYDTEKEVAERITAPQGAIVPGEPRVGLIGAGSFAQNILLPSMKNHCHFIGIATRRSNNGQYVFKKYRFAYATGKPDDLVRDPNINTLFITTRHHEHAEWVIKGLESGKHVFVEKPLALNREELNRISDAYRTRNNPHPSIPSDLQVSSLLMTGFNRRFSPLTREILHKIPPGRIMSMNFRINAGQLPPGHWVHDPEVGGGRIIGELCHFIDLAIFHAGSEVTSLYAQVVNDALNLRDTLSVNLKFRNGSIAAIQYFSNGSKRLPKEYYEFFSNGIVVINNDFRRLKIYDGQREKSWSWRQDKGHGEEIRRFLTSVREGKPSPIPFEQLVESTQVTFDVLTSIRENRVIIYE